MRHTMGCALVFTVVMAAVTLCPSVATAIMYCGLGPSGQSCAEFPIVTHWVNTGGGGFNLAGTDADPRRLTIPPGGYQNYNGMTTDTYAPSDVDGRNFIDAVEQATGVPVIMYNYDSDTALSKLQDPAGQNKLRVMHNVLLPLPGMNSLFTFFFPPGWQPTNRYPILLSGNGWLTSNNTMFFVTEQSRAIAIYVAQSTQLGRTGLIAALSNAGGREAQGWHADALNDVARMLNFMDTQGYGVDRFRGVNFGGSRGGGTALLWGENPLNSPLYRSIGVFAMAPPSHGGFISQQALASYQYLHGVLINGFNDTTADRYDRVPRLIDVNPVPGLTHLLNQDDPGKTDRPQEDNQQDDWRKSASGYLSFLAQQPLGNLGPPGIVVLSVGTHDSIIPLPMVLKLDRTLRDRWAIPHLTCLTLRTGHNADEDECPRAELERFLLYLVTPGTGYSVPNVRRYFQATDLTNHVIGTAVELPGQTTLPFSIVIPYRLRADQWATLAACGQSGTSFTATLTNASGAVVFSLSRTFGVNTTSDFAFTGTGPQPDPECEVRRLDQPGAGWGSLPVGTYYWSFTVNGQTINPGNLSYQGDPSWGRPTVATTIVDSTQPEQAVAIFDPQGSITMGVDAF